MSANSPRLDYLESIRGIAAVQVLVLHIFSAFFPMMVFWSREANIQTAIHYSPLFIFYNGYASVYIFFVLSGLVLTLAFARDIGRPWKLVTSRYIRLAIPALAACLLALVVTTVLGTPNVETGKMTGSDIWLQVLWQMPHDLVFFLKDALLNSVFLGYQQTSTLFMLGLPISLDDIHTSYVSPMWTLSAEFHGSLLVLLWTFMHQKNRTAWITILLVSMVFLAFTYFLCFAIGHLIALRMKNGRIPCVHWPIAGALLLIGAAICLGAETWTTLNFNDICTLTSGLHMPCTGSYQHTIGAMIMFIGVIHCTPLTKVLEARPLVYLGKLSFSIYLVHWPIIMGVAPFVFLLIKDAAGDFTAKLICSVLAFVIALLIAIPFSQIDQLAIAISRKVKQPSHSV
jgi:peptidoglycan/LPS O-acetylase OafA/YrhL